MQQARPGAGLESARNTILNDKWQQKLGLPWSALQQAQPDAGLEPARENSESNGKLQERARSDTGCRKWRCNTGAALLKLGGRVDWAVPPLLERGWFTCSSGGRAA